MLEGFIHLIPVGVATGLAGWFGNAYLVRLKIKAEGAKALLDVDAVLEKHRDGLTFQLLDAARTELVLMRGEVEKLRPMESHLYHLQQALEHIEALLNPDPDSRALAERNARAFLNRMRRLEDAKGTIANEIQRQRAAETLGIDPEDTAHHPASKSGLT